ncbi:unnamed protein product [Chrysoparadoxa australica]
MAGDALCSIVGLDDAGVKRVLDDGTIMLQAVPHLAKLAKSLRMEVMEAPHGRDAGGAEGTPVLPYHRHLHEMLDAGTADGLDVDLTPGARSQEQTTKLVERWLKLLRRGMGPRHLEDRHFWYSLKDHVQENEARADADSHRRLLARQKGWAALIDGSSSSDWSACSLDTVSASVTPSGERVKLLVGAEEPSECVTLLLAVLTAQHEVYRVDIAHRAVPMNFEAAWVSQSGVRDYTPLWDWGIQGQGEIIGVADTGVDIRHCQFADEDEAAVEPSDWFDPVTDLDARKVVQYIKFADDIDEADGHGTHVAGTLAGSNGGAEDNGLAFEAKLAVFDFGDTLRGNALDVPGDLYLMMLQPAYEAGARVHSNSWGTLNNEYNRLDHEVDRFLHERRNTLVVVAAGNCGDVQGSSFECGAVLQEADALSVLSPAQGKNALAVGASLNGDGGAISTVAHFSSRGPTPDGRIKPDICAPGSPLTSAAADPSQSSCRFADRVGTSMAAPVAAASAALARQYFVQGWYATGGTEESAVENGFEPSGALLKAVLVNSAQGLSAVQQNPNPTYRTSTVGLSAPPDGFQGHGRIAVDQSLNVNGTVGLFFQDWAQIQEGQALTYNVTILPSADASKSLRVTLVWMDPPQSSGAARAVVHDLNLRVIDRASGNVFYPNGLSGADQANNVEKVTLPSTTPGAVYDIEITAPAISESDSQYFAVVANGEFIKTNPPPVPPDDDGGSVIDDLRDAAESVDISWQLGVEIALGLLACCLISCMCRRCFYERDRHKERTALAFVDRYPSMPSPAFLELSGIQPYSRTREEAPVPEAYDACPECGIPFSDVAELVEHVVQVHDGQARRPPPPRL